MAVTNLSGELQQPAHSTERDGNDASVTPPPFKGTRSAPDHTRRHSLPLHSLPQNLWSANTSRASLIESEDAARGEHSLDEATVAHRISALRQLNGATRTKHQYAKSTGARNSTFSQPVIVRTYSGTRPQSRQREAPVKKEVPTMKGKAELPPVEAFSFKGIMESIQSGVTEDLERIAEICARSRYSLSNQYEVHMPPHGEGDPFLRAPGHATLQTISIPVGGPTLQAIGSDDEGTRPIRRSGRRVKSMAYGTLETIMSSSRSSDEEKERKKSAAVIADEVRGRAARQPASFADELNGNADDERGPNPRHTRSRSTAFASLMVDNAQGGKADATSHIVSTVSLLSEPARPRTSLAEHDHPLMDDAATVTSMDVDSMTGTKPALSRHDSRASTLRPDLFQRSSVLTSLSAWLPWTRAIDPTVARTDPTRSKSNAEGSLRELLKATDQDRKGKGVDRAP